MMNRAVKGLFSILLSFCLISSSGCVQTNRDNYEKQYRKYLSYSLGNYTFTRKTYQYTAAPLPLICKGYIWTAIYTDDQGTEKEFVFANKAGPDEASDEYFAQYVANAAKQAAYAEMSALTKPFFSANEIPELYTTQTGAKGNTISRDPIFTIYQDTVDLNKLIDPQTGLQLKSITTKELIESWNFRFSLEYSVKAHEQLPLYKKKAEVLAADIADYLDMETLEFTLNERGTNQCSILHYNKSTHTFSWKTIHT